MSDYVAYYESSAGHYMPIIVKDKGGDKVYRDMTRDDIRGIEDSYMNGGDSEAPGGWLYKKGQGARASWSKRYMLLKGQYLFYFHGPQNDRPVGVIPIENCEIILPPDNGKSFSGNRFFRANDGFEFEISHLERRPFQLYAATDHDRSLWLQRLNARTGRMYGGVGKDSHILIRERTASITGAKSSGDGVSNVAITNTKVFARDLNSNVDDSSMDESRLFAGKSVADPFAPPLPPAQMSGKSGTSIDSGGDGEVSAAALAAISQRTLQHNKPLAFNSPSLVPSLKKTDMHMHSSGAGDVASVSSSSKLESALAYSLEKDDDVKRIALEERSNLEKDLQEKFRLQQEGRKREAQARER